MGLDAAALRLPDLDEEVRKPTLIDVERFTPFDAGKSDRAHEVAIVFIEPGDAADAGEGRLGGLGTARFDELEVLRRRLWRVPARKLSSRR